MPERKKRKIRVIGFIVGFCFLSGCAEAPQEVLDEMHERENRAEIRENDGSTDTLDESGEEVQSADTREDTGEVVFIKVSDLAGSVSEHMEESRDNLVFDGTVTVPAVDRLYDLELEPCTSFYYNRETLIPELLAWFQLPCDNWQNEIETHVDADCGIYEGLREDASYDLYENQAFISVLSSHRRIDINRGGSLVLTNELEVNMERLGTDHVWPWSEVPQQYEVWHLWNHEMPETEVVLGEESVSLQELCLDFEQAVELYNSMDEELGLRLYNAVYYEMENRGSCVLMQALQSYKGVCFDPTEVPGNIVDGSGRSYLGGRLKGLYHVSGDRCFIALHRSYVPVKELAVYDEVISFESALNLLQDRLGDHYMAVLEEADLFYLRYYYGENGNSWIYYEEEPITVYAHPYWRFVERMEGKDTAMSRTVFYVDAISGEVKCFYENCILY
ncbi:MAG: hypothetical protein ACI4SE_10010 [Lachnospiraceae bacterium]